MKRFIAEIFLLALLATLFAAGVVWYKPFEQVEIEAIKKTRKVSLTWCEGQGVGKVLYIDARSEAEFEKARLDGAIWMSLDNLQSGMPSLLDKWDPEKTIVVYCGGKGCAGAEELAAYLREKMGMEKVYTLIGGWEAGR